jgi:integrase
LSSTGSRRHIRTISLEEEIACFAAASQPLKDIARIILDTGMRPDEVFRIEFANLDFEHRSIFNAFGKTPAARRSLTMTDEVHATLKKRAVSAKSRYAFPSPANPDRQIGRVHKAHYGAVKRAGIKPRFVLYDLRLLCITGRHGWRGSPNIGSTTRPYEHPNDYAVCSSS